MGKIRKVLVTGAAGFLGSHLCDHLQKLNYHVVGVDSMIGGDIENLPNNIEFHKADCCDFKKMNSIMQDVDVLYHCAATAHEGLSVFSPVEITKNNYLATVSVVTAAINRNVKSSPRKVNLLLKNIRGKKADIAIRDLSFARQRIAFDIKKTVQAAISNAENNYQYDIDNLYVHEAYVGKSIVLKRFRARAKGRASGIKKPFTNVTIILSEKINKKEETHGTKS